MWSFFYKEINLSFHSRVQNNRGSTKKMEIVKISEAQETPRGECDNNREPAGGNGSLISQTEWLNPWRVEMPLLECIKEENIQTEWKWEILFVSVYDRDS